MICNWLYAEAPSDPPTYTYEKFREGLTGNYPELFTIRPFVGILLIILFVLILGTMIYYYIDRRRTQRQNFFAYLVYRRFSSEEIHVILRICRMLRQDDQLIIQDQALFDKALHIYSDEYHSAFAKEHHIISSIRHKLGFDRLSEPVRFYKTSEIKTEMTMELISMTSGRRYLARPEASTPECLPVRLLESDAFLNEDFKTGEALECLVRQSNLGEHRFITRILEIIVGPAPLFRLEHSETILYQKRCEYPEPAVKMKIELAKLSEQKTRTDQLHFPAFEAIVYKEAELLKLSPKGALILADAGLLSGEHLCLRLALIPERPPVICFAVVVTSKELGIRSEIVARLTELVGESEDILWRFIYRQQRQQAHSESKPPGTAPQS